jgi:hypothetical protein
MKTPVVGTISGVKPPTKKGSPKNVEAKKKLSGTQAHLKLSARRPGSLAGQTIDTSYKTCNEVTAQAPKRFVTHWSLR